jgi:hypothetical protein
MIGRAVLLTVAAVSASCAADLYPVADTVVNTGTNAPLPHARVNFYLSAAAKPVASAITGDDGRFQFQLPAGSYRVLAGTRNTWENYGARHPGDALGSAVIVGPGKDTASLVFRFFPPAAISGRVLDNSGEPARDALVQLIRSSVTGGRRSATVFAYHRTNDLGEYRFGRLPGDSLYFLAVTSEPWYTQAGLPGPSEAKVAAAYAPIYYPNTSDAFKAAPIALKQGEEARADFSLSTVSNATVTVRHNAPPGMKGTVTLTYDGVAGTFATQQTQQLLVGFQPPSQSGQDQPGQTQILQGVPPGHYTLRIVGTAGSSVLGASTAVDVNGSGVTADLALKPFPKVEGVVHLAPGASQKSAIVVSMRGELSGGVGTVTVQGDGSFKLPQATPGRFRITLGGRDGFLASEIEARGGSIKDGILEISEGSDVILSITASNESGDLRGFVVDGDRPLEGVLAVLAPAGGQKGELTVTPRAFQTESDGSFNFRSIPAGHYLLFAVDDSQLEYARPDVIAPYLPGAKEIEIRSRTSAEERIPLAPPPAR